VSASLVDLKIASERTGRSRRWLRARIARGLLPASKPANALEYRVDLRDIEALCSPKLCAAPSRPKRERESEKARVVRQLAAAGIA
jgi:ATP-dependent helicase YprA (DUF1998 family)